MSKIQTFVKLWRENGIFVTAQHLASYFPRLLRNRPLASRFRVKQINIDRGSYIRGIGAIDVGENFTAGPNLWLEAVLRYGSQAFSPRIKIGADVVASHGCHIGATRYVEIGDGVLLGSKVIIIDHNHGEYSGPHSPPTIPPHKRHLSSDREVIIGRNVWIGDGVVIGPGARVGEGSVIGANSVVTREIPPFTIAAGSPARAIKRFDFDTKEWINVP